MWVYLLWSHEEDGPEDLVATLDREKVCELGTRALSLWTSDNPAVVEKVQRAAERLANHIKSGAGPGIYPLMDGWGGLHLQIAVLD